MCNPKLEEEEAEEAVGEDGLLASTFAIRRDEEEEEEDGFECINVGGGGRKLVGLFIRWIRDRLKRRVYHWQDWLV